MSRNEASRHGRVNRFLSRIVRLHHESIGCFNLRTAEGFRDWARNHVSASGDVGGTRSGHRCSRRWVNKLPGFLESKPAGVSRR